MGEAFCPFGHHATAKINRNVTSPFPGGLVCGISLANLFLVKQARVSCATPCQLRRNFM